MYACVKCSVYVPEQSLGGGLPAEFCGAVRISGGCTHSVEPWKGRLAGVGPRRRCRSCC
jgi:hypothetical protein